MKNFYFSNNLIFFLCGVLREHANANSVRQSGDDSCGVPPVPISNTAVKPTYAESTWLEAAWEDRELPVYSLVAQLVEQSAVNRSVVGSSPTRGAKYRGVAKSVRQRTLTPSCVGSSPAAPAKQLRFTIGDNCPDARRDEHCSGGVLQVR